MYGNFMRKEDVLNYLNNNFGEAYSNPQIPVCNDDEGREFYSTVHVEDLFTNKKLWRKMESEVLTFMFLGKEVREMLENLATQN